MDYDPEEDAIICEEYDSNTGYNKAYERLGHRSRKSIQGRAHALGLTTLKLELEEVSYAASRELDAAYVSGLFDGEAHFRHARLKPRGFSTNMEMTLRADDKPLLLWLVEFLGCGSVYDLQYKAKGNQKPQARFAVNHVVDLRNRIVPLLDQFPLRGKKRNDYEIWREALVIRFEDYKVKPAPRKEELERLADEIVAVRKYLPSEAHNVPADKFKWRKR